MSDSIQGLLADNLIFLFIAGMVLLFTGLESLSRVTSVRLRKAIILVISGLLIIWLDWRSFLLLLFLSSVIYLMISKQAGIRKNLYILVPASIGLLVLIKDYGVIFHIEDPYIPLGVSFYFFRMISVLIEYANRPEDLKNTAPLDFFCYMFFFPIFLAGPIQRINDFFELDREYVVSNRHRFYLVLAASVALKIVLVDGLLAYMTYSLGLPRIMHMLDSPQDANYAFLKLSLFGITAFIHAYLDLMLYTEISKSISRILGFHIQENFNRPLLATNISAFWQRWHMSLSNWTRDYVFFPALLKTRNTHLSTYLSMLTIAVWHSATMSWIIWGLAHATAINLYGEFKKTGLYARMTSTPAGSRIGAAAGNFLTIYFVGFIFIFVAIQDVVLVGRLLALSVKGLII